MEKKSMRPIDRIRNAAFQMEIGTEHEGRITDAIATKEKLYFVKTHAIYSVLLADNIDPERQNPNIPNAQQKELPVGSDAPVVARILLTAKRLFSKTALGQSFDVEAGLECALCILKDVESLRGMRVSLENAQREAETKQPSRDVRLSSFHLPSVADIETRFDAFAQKVGHVVDGLEGLAKIFYPTELQTKWIDSLAKLAKDRHGQDSPFALYMNRVCPFLLSMRKLRNMIEHPKPNEFIRVHNFRLLPSGELARPSVEIVWPDSQLENNPMTALIEYLADNLVNVCEALLVYLCDANINMHGAFSSLRVVPLPPDQRRFHQEIRYSYGYYDGKSMIPIVVG
jgi:hypothetical protein